MNRRELLMGAVALAAAASARQALAHDHEPGGMHQHAASEGHTRLIQAAADCVSKAQICLQHCLISLGKGETELAACARSSSQVEAICSALQSLAAANAKQLPQLARVAMDICKECEEECKKTEKHPECKACKEACTECYEACRKIAV